MNFVSGFLQWLHVMSAVLAVGGVFFMRFILHPSLAAQADARAAIAPLIMRRFKMVIHSSIAILILTGVYRFVSTLDKLHGWAAYHAVFGIKVLLSLALFTIAIMLTMPVGPNPNPIQRNKEKWITMSFVLGAVIILLSACLRRMWDVHS